MTSFFSLYYFREENYVEQRKSKYAMERVLEAEYLNWICGFANTQGGKLYISEDDNGNIIGLSNASKLLDVLPSKIRDSLGLVADVNLLEDNDKEYIEIKLEACERVNLPLPIYYVHPTDIMIQFNAPKHMVIEDYIYMYLERDRSVRAIICGSRLYSKTIK